MSGNKNAFQGIGSAVTYLQRYTLKAALGIAARKDDDGIAAGRRSHSESSPAQRPPETTKTPPRANSGPKHATEKHRARMLEVLCAEHGDQKVIAYSKFAYECTPDAWPLEHVPTDKLTMDRLVKAVGDWWGSEWAEDARTKATDETSDTPEAKEDELPAGIANVVWHIPPAGVLKANYTPETIGILYAKRHDPKVAARLFGHMNNYDPSEGWTDSKGVHHEASQQDLDLRKGLDDLADFMEAKKQTEMDLDIAP